MSGKCPIGAAITNYGNLLLLKAYHLGLYGRKYVWFFIGWYADTWFVPPKDEILNCTKKQVFFALIEENNDARLTLYSLHYAPHFSSSIHPLKVKMDKNKKEYKSNFYFFS